MAAKPQKGTLQHEITRWVTGTHTAFYRLTGGWLGGWMGGPVLLLTTRGRKSGRLRTHPLPDPSGQENFFRKGELMDSGVVGEDMVRVVPARPRIQIRPHQRDRGSEKAVARNAAAGPTTRPSTAKEPAPILVIPKDQLDKPLDARDAEMVRAD